MKLTIKLFTASTLSLVLALTAVPIPSAQATLAGWSAGNIMSDSVMGNYKTMSEAKIQSFLKSKNACNNSNLSWLTSYTDTKGYYKSTLAGKPYTYTYTLKNGKFVCMHADKFNGESAARIIYRAAQDYKINPQVLIVLLEKEQSLIRDTFPNNIQYRGATGYGCPDTAPCDAQYYGLKNQVRKAAAMFREVLDGGWSNYPVGKRYVQYNPNASCGGSTINIINRATSALYRYTPYQPNKAALAAGWGTAHCGAYGNRNFYNFFTDWFGKTTAIVRGSIKVYYDKYGPKIGVPLANERGDGTGKNWQQFTNGYIVGSAKTKYWESRGSIRDYWLKTGGVSKSKFGMPLAGEVAMTGYGGGMYQRYEKGYIIGKDATGYWESRGSIRDYWIANGGRGGRIGYPVADQTIIGCQEGGYYQRYERAHILGKGNTGYWESWGPIRDYVLANGGHCGSIGYPIGSIVNHANGNQSQKFENGTVTYTKATDTAAFKK